MANLASAKKRARQNVARNRRLSAARSRMRTFIKKTNKLIEAKDVKEASEQFKVLQEVLDKATSKGLIHKNLAARKKHRINAKIKDLVQSAEAN